MERTTAFFDLAFVGFFFLALDAFGELTDSFSLRWVFLATVLLFSKLVCFYVQHYMTLVLFKQRVIKGAT